jgi:hypothetical protein
MQGLFWTMNHGGFKTVPFSRVYGIVCGQQAHLGTRETGRTHGGASLCQIYEIDQTLMLLFTYQDKRGRIRL